MARRVLCVAEKPSIAKALASALGGGDVQKRKSDSKYIWNYELAYNSTRWGPCAITVTSAAGHITDIFFPPPYDKFSCDGFQLFTAPVECKVMPDNRKVASNIERLARKTSTLYIWTDCDREGEHIGGEVYDIVRRVNPRLVVFRASFNNAEPTHLREAFDKPGPLDFCQIDAVNARRELDLRSGFSMTRLQTKMFKQHFSHIVGSRAVQYGACQFPTLGFVVDRHLRVQNFKPESFWTIDAYTKTHDLRLKFNWKRGQIFDHLSALMFYERALESADGDFIVSKAKTKPAVRYKLLPLTTVTLQRKGASALRMSSKSIMDHAEKLYNDGFVSYPRTETDRYNDSINLKQLLSSHCSSGAPWSAHARSLKANNWERFDPPRKGKHDDAAHPPIHPVRSVTQRAFGSDNDRWRVYEFICRHFLASCSRDAKGSTTTFEVFYGTEAFQICGDQVLELNFLEVYTYMKWTGRLLPAWYVGDKIPCVSFNLRESKTNPPKLLTEPDLVGLMDANGIGTDATMAEHITKIQDREYVKKTGQFLEPMPLGVALVQGYEKLRLEYSLTKPFFRRDTELAVTTVAKGERRVADVLKSLLTKYEAVYKETQLRQRDLINEAKKYLMT